MKRLAFIAAAVLLTSSCAPTVVERGNLLTQRQVTSITAGTSTRSDVLRVLGSPTTTAPFDESLWYYIGQETAKHGIFDPEVVRERVVEVKFSADGIVDYIREKPQGAGVDVPFADEKTPTYGNETSVMQQFFGNLGKFNKPADTKPGR